LVILLVAIISPAWSETPPKHSVIIIAGHRRAGNAQHLLRQRADRRMLRHSIWLFVIISRHHLGGH
jgi:hypothetical protein